MNCPVDIAGYNESQPEPSRAICERLAAELSQGLPQAEAKLWHGGPVWFLDSNPLAGYWVRKKGVQLLFWSGQSFDEPGLQNEGKFKAAEIHFQQAGEIDSPTLQNWLNKATLIQWDYKNIVKRRGRLEKIGEW